MRRRCDPPAHDNLESSDCVYTLVNSTWSYWRLTESDRPIAIERQIVLSLALMAPAVDEADCS